MTTPETARCACSHTVEDHQLVTRDVDTGYRPMKRRMRTRALSFTRREHCTRCDCKGPR